MPRVVVISPPFASHARPLSVLAAALAEHGAEVYFACSPAFEHLATDVGLRFVPLTVTRNANTGSAETTDMEAEEAARLSEFLEATRSGPMATLTTQARHRRADMLADPDRVFDELRALHERIRPDWYVVDQLSYSVTLALHCLRLRYATFCPGHPTYVLAGPDSWFGVPYDWPEALRPTEPQLADLIATAQGSDRAFSKLFEEFARRRAPEAPSPGRAFALTSPHAVVYAYPQLPWLPSPPAGPDRVHAGHMVGSPRPLDDAWDARIRELRGRSEQLVLVALGTFLAARDDVLRTVVSGALEHAGTHTAVVVAAGARMSALADLADDRVVVAPYVPQQSLLPQVDVMVHHGGANSFTECLRFGVPALVLPFSSDQFAVARDAERAGVGLVRDPNALSPADVPEALDSLRASAGPRVKQWARELGARGPLYAANRLMATMNASAFSEGSDRAV